MVVVVADCVLLQRRVISGRPVHEAPGVTVREGETPGHAAARAAQEHLGLEVAIGDLVFADTEHGAEHYFFLADVRTGGEAARLETDGLLSPIRLAAVLAYVIEPYGLAVSLARLLRGASRSAHEQAAVATPSRPETEPPSPLPPNKAPLTRP